MYTIRNAGAKGLGIFAARHIPLGTRILAERPLFSVRSERDAFAAFRKLPAEEQNWLRRLSTNGADQSSLFSWLPASWHAVRHGILPGPAAISGYNTFLPIFRNNNFDIGGGMQAMFREICRLNHSCVPNSQGNFNEAIGKFTIHATRPVELDEEITISYLVEHGAVKESRQSRLRRGYGFDCDCSLCDPKSPVGQQSEQRRNRMRERLEKHAELASLSGKSNEASDLKMLMDVINMFEEEGLAGRELSTMYLAAAEKHVNLGHKEEGRRCADLGIQTEAACLGTDNPSYQESVERMKRVI